MAAETRVRDGFASVLALKAIPALSQAHPDDLIGLALRTVERRVPAGARLEPSVPGEPALFFVVEGRVREREGDGTVYEAPALPGLRAVLAGDEAPALAADGEAVALEISRPALLEVLEEEFELCVAMLRHACRIALEEGGRPSGGEPEPRERRDRFDPADLAERIVLLRAAGPFAGLRIALLGQLAVEMEPVEAEGGEVLWEPDEPATRMLVIAAGDAEAEGPERGEARRLGPGALVGLPETLAAGDYGFRLRARGPLQALQLDGEELLDALEDDAASAVELLCALARHSRGGTR
jgi:hypothetical protein